MKAILILMAAVLLGPAGARAQEGLQPVPRAHKWLSNNQVVFSYDYSYTDSTCFSVTVPRNWKKPAVRQEAKAPEKYAAFPLQPEGAVNLTYSPDSTKLAFTRETDLWVADIATGKERRLTSRGRKNVDPDWGPDGRIAYVAGANIAVMDPAKGDSGARTVTEAANWEHPSWSRDGRHLAASRDKALFLIDTLEGGDKPRQMFRASGNWMSPCWAR